MPLFMLIAGSSAYFALRKRGLIEFAKERISRIFVPLILGILLIVPPQVYVERVYRDQFIGSYWAFYPHFFEGIYPQGNFSWHHLWFLAYLLVYSMLAMPLFNFLHNQKGRPIYEKFVVLLQKPLGLLLFAIPLALFHVALFW